MMEHFEKLLGEKNVSDSLEQLEKYSVTGKIPSLVLFPASSDQISEIMKLAKRDGKKILIAGNNSQHHFGAAIEGIDWCISLNRMNQIIEHESADLIVTVEPGVTLPQLQMFLNKHKQVLPLDPIGVGDRSLGGIVASNSQGSLRLAYGTCRDLVLGMKVVLPNGTIIRIGGKTVKNVAGYDLSKLFIGSMGTLGVIAEITFKLYPLPAKSQTRWAEFDQFDDIPRLVQSIGSSNLVISRCEYLNAVFVEKYLDKNYQSKQPHVLLFNIQGHSDMVNTTMEKMQQMVLNNGGKNIQIFSNKNDIKLWNRINAANSSNQKSHIGFYFQLSIPKAFFGPVISEIENFSNKNILLPLAIQAHAVSGIINIFWDGLDEKEILPDRYRSQIESLRQIAQSSQGNMVVNSIPKPEETVTSGVFSSRSLKEPELIWGIPGIEFSFMKSIKTKYDPGQVFAAGRFIGGL